MHPDILTSTHLQISYKFLRFIKLLLILFRLQVEEDSTTQVAKATQAEQDQYEMQVRAANIVCIILFPLKVHCDD